MRVCGAPGGRCVRQGRHAAVRGETAEMACRKKASLLLMRQHFLEELMHENELAVPLPAAPESESDAEDKGYFMSSPSYY